MISSGDNTGSDPVGDLKGCEKALTNVSMGYSWGQPRPEDLAGVCSRSTAGLGHPYVLHCTDGVSYHLCSVPEQCVQADLEDTLWIRAYGGHAHWYEPPGASVPAMHETIGGQILPGVAVCIEGLAWRINLVNLQRLARALWGLGVDHSVVAVAKAREANNDCREERHTYRRAFGAALAEFVCVSEQPSHKVRSDFFTSTRNASWWTVREPRFSLLKGGDVKSLVDTLRNLQMKSRCLDAVESIERSRGGKFDWLAYVRSDYDFLEAHPPLRHMSARGGIWVPDGEDYGGLNDRWAVMQRKHAFAYFRRWESFLDGSAIPMFEREFHGNARFGSGDPSYGQVLNPEVSLLLHLHWHKVWPEQVSRFLPTAALSCVRSSPSCEVRSSIVGRPGWRHLSEFSNARGVAWRLQHGWTWALATPRLLHPKCPMNFRIEHAHKYEYEYSSCCASRPRRALYGQRSCFDGVFYTRDRCCRSSEQDPSLLSVAPPPNVTGAPHCWKLLYDQRLDTAACVL